MKLGKLSEDLSIKRDAFLFERADECAVRKSQRPNSGIDLDIPKSSEIIFFLAAVRECVFSGMDNSLARLAFFRASSKAISFDLLKDVPSSF